MLADSTSHILAVLVTCLLDLCHLSCLVDLACHTEPVVCLLDLSHLLKLLHLLDLA